MPPKKARRGRPPLQATEQRRHILSVRVRDKMRIQLEEAAKESGRSLSQEAEFRIEQSFEYADMNDRVAALVSKHVKRLIP